MHSGKPLIVSRFDPGSRTQLHGRAPLLSSQKLGWKQVNFDYYQYGNCETPVHYTEHHAIGLILQSGKVERKLDGMYRYESTNFGSVAIIPAQVEHWSAWKDIGKFIILSITPDAIADIASDTINPDQIELIPTFATSQPDHLISGIGMAMKQELITDPYGCDLYIEHLTNALLVHLLRNYCNIRPQFADGHDGLANTKLQQAINYINDNLHQKIRITEIAQLLDLNNYYFCHLFRQSIGISPYQYVIKQRVEKAKLLLKQSQLSLTEISGECGFSSQSQMTQHFRKLTGITPKKYREL